MALLRGLRAAAQEQPRSSPAAAQEQPGSSPGAAQEQPSSSPRAAAAQEQPSSSEIVRLSIYIERERQVRQQGDSRDNYIDFVRVTDGTLNRES